MVSHRSWTLPFALLACLVTAACEEEGDAAPDAGDGPAAWEDPCDGDCASGTYTECTCAKVDRCNWSGDGVCDWSCLESVGFVFEDFSDCTGTSGPGGSGDGEGGNYPPQTDGKPPMGQ